jgi:hypothetical protein
MIALGPVMSRTRWVELETDKRRKKLLFVWARGGATGTAQYTEVFLLLLVHKKKPSSALKHDLFAVFGKTDPVPGREVEGQRCATHRL